MYQPDVHHLHADKTLPSGVKDYPCTSAESSATVLQFRTTTKEPCRSPRSTQTLRRVLALISEMVAGSQLHIESSLRWEVSTSTKMHKCLVCVLDDLV